MLPSALMMLSVAEVYPDDEGADKTKLDHEVIAPELEQPIRGTMVSTLKVRLAGLAAQAPPDAESNVEIAPPVSPAAQIHVGFNGSRTIE